MDDIEQKEQLELTPEILNDSHFYDKFMQYHTYEQAQFYALLEKEDRLRVRQQLTPDEMCLIFELVENDEDNIQELFLEIDKNYALNMLLSMSKDNAVDLLKKMSPDVARNYLKQLPNDTVTNIMSLFQHPDETAGALMTTEYITVSATQSALEALESIKQQARTSEIINYAYVVDINNKLLGIVSLRDILTASHATFIPDIMIDRIVSVSVNDNQETVAKIIRDYDFIALPVLSDDDELLGIVTVDDIMDIIDEEAISDYSALAGVDVEDVETSIVKSAFSRIPWLIVLMVLATFTSVIISNYNQLIAQNAVLYTFITLMTGTAGNAGTQALAVTIRKLAIQNKISAWKFVWDEFLVGLLLGLLTGLIVMFIVGIQENNWHFAIILGVSMLVSIVIATLVGNLIPIIIIKIGIDPAVASGPFINTLCDLTSVITYFTIANMFLQYII